MQIKPAIHLYYYIISIKGDLYVDPPLSLLLWDRVNLEYQPYYTILLVFKYSYTTPQVYQQYSDDAKRTAAAAPFEG